MDVFKNRYLYLKHCIGAVLFLFAGIGNVGGNCIFGDTAVGTVLCTGNEITDIALEKRREEMKEERSKFFDFVKTAPGDTIYVDDTVELVQFDFEKWFLPKQLEVFAHGNTTMETATWYSRYSPFGQFMESRSIAGLGLIYRISHLSELNKFQNIMRWNSEFTVNVDVHYSKREFDRSIFGDYDYPNYYDGSKGLNYVQSNTGVTRYSSLWVMPEYRLCVRFSDFRENKGRLGIEGSIGIGFVGNIQLAASGEIVQARDYYKFTGNSNYDYRFSQSDLINYSASQAKIDYPQYDGCMNVRAGLYYKLNKSVRFTTGLQITSTAMGAETIDGYFRVHYLLGEQQNRKEAFKK